MKNERDVISVRREKLERFKEVQKELQAISEKEDVEGAEFDERFKLMVNFFAYPSFLKIKLKTKSAPPFNISPLYNPIAKEKANLVQSS